MLVHSLCRVAASSVDIIRRSFQEQRVEARADYWLAAINVLISSRTGKSKFSGAEKFPASLFPKPTRHILDMIDLERRGEYVLADVKSATWFFECWLNRVWPNDVRFIGFLVKWRSVSFYSVKYSSVKSTFPFSVSIHFFQAQNSTKLK
jgi:hypothetical protein